MLRFMKGRDSYEILPKDRSHPVSIHRMEYLNKGDFIFLRERYIGNGITAPEMTIEILRKYIIVDGSTDGRACFDVIIVPNFLNM